jgi:hypothetical protein
MTDAVIATSRAVPSLPVRAVLAPPRPAPPLHDPMPIAPPLFVGARHAVPVLPVLCPGVKLRPPLEHPSSDHATRHKRPPTVKLSPLNATVTKCQGEPSDTASLRAQISVSSHPRVEARHAVPAIPIAPTPPLNLTPLNATVTKYQGGAC